MERSQTADAWMRSMKHITIRMLYFQTSSILQIYAKAELYLPLMFLHSRKPKDQAFKPSLPLVSEHE